MKELCLLYDYNVIYKKIILPKGSSVVSEKEILINENSYGIDLEIS